MIMMEPMNYRIWTQSLEYRVLVRIAVTLWNQEDAKDLVEKFHFSKPDPSLNEMKEEWDRVHDEVMKKIPDLPLPGTLKEKLLRHVASTGWQIIIWKDHHKDYVSAENVKRSLNKFCWTPRGTIDKIKTAEVIIRDQSLNILDRFKLACKYRLENYVSALREQLRKLPERCISTRLEERSPIFLPRFPEGRMLHPLANSTGRNTMGIGDLCSEIESRIRFASESMSEASVRYLLRDLSPEERKIKLVEYAQSAVTCSVYVRYASFPTEYYADILCFLLPQMSTEEQEELFKCFPYQILRCFLFWPYQDILLAMLKRILNCLPEDQYCRFLQVIDHMKSAPGYRDFNYQQLFETIWEESSDSHKKYVLDRRSTRVSYLSNLFAVKSQKSMCLHNRELTLEK